MRHITSLFLFMLILPVTHLHPQELQLAHIGDFKLEDGEVIRYCVIGYRTFGHLNADRTNAVLFPTAFGWKSSGPGRCR